MPQTHPPERPTAESAFVSAIEDLSPADLKLLRCATGRALGSDVLTYDLFNRVWRPIRSKAILARWACYAVATLYPWHPLPGGRGDFGGTMRRPLRAETRENRAAAGDRFARLLAATGPALLPHLVGAVRWLAARQMPVDWRQLLTDLARWYEPGRPTQTEWAQSYFGNS